MRGVALTGTAAPKSMDTFLHAIERSFLHIVSAAFVLRLVQIGCVWGARRVHWFPTVRGLGWWIWPSCAAAAIIFLREPYDVWKGGPVWKSYLDAASWLAGLALASWANAKLCRRDLQAVEERSGRLMRRDERVT